MKKYNILSLYVTTAKENINFIQKNMLSCTLNRIYFIWIRMCYWICLYALPFIKTCQVLKLFSQKINSLHYILKKFIAFQLNEFKVIIIVLQRHEIIDFMIRKIWNDLSAESIDYHKSISIFPIGSIGLLVLPTVQNFKVFSSFPLNALTHSDLKMNHWLNFSNM